jgi:C-terminal processing protease CtpA/Prc
VWKAFDETYPYFGLKHVDWPAARALYRPQAAQAQGVDGLNDVLLPMLATLRDVHVSLESPGGQRRVPFSSARPRNIDAAQWQRTVAAHGWTQHKVNLGSARINGVPYIAIGAWNSAQFSVADLDAVLEPFRNDPVIMVDVRANGGGNDALALDFARRFTDRTVLTEIFRFRTGPGPNDLGRETRRTIGPRGAWQYEGRVYVLSGRGVFSSNESFVAAMRELPRVLVVGDTTGGGTANPKPFPYLAGWRVWVSTWYATTPDGRPIEGVGIPPDVYLPWSSVPGRDPVIDATLSLALLPP